MITVNKSRKVKCPHCGGNGLVIEIRENSKYVAWDRKEKSDIREEQRLPDLTGTKDQCEEAKIIRSIFVQKAKRQYQTELFKTFIKLISYESHSFFWICNKSCKIEGLIGKIAVKNPTAFELIDKMQ